MAGFDITSILDFRPPRYLCYHCRGLFKKFRDVPVQGDPWHPRVCCPVCECEYIQDKDLPYTSPGQFLVDSGFTVEYGRDLFEHAQILATLIKTSQGRYPWPTMRLFFEILSRAKHFVHFASWGISHLMIGALKITSMRVPVMGFVSNVEEHARVELEEFPAEAPKMRARVIQSRLGAWDAPHQKLIVVDGLVAFTGSTNLTNNAIRKADRGLDISEVVTNFERVSELNNRYFAPVWKKLECPDQDVVIVNGPPF